MPQKRKLSQDYRQSNETDAKKLVGKTMKNLLQENLHGFGEKS